MRRFVDTMSRQNLFREFFHLIGHLGEELRQPVDLFALRDRDAVEIFNRAIGMCQVDLKLLDPRFVILCHRAFLVVVNRADIGVIPRKNNSIHRIRTMGINCGHECYMTFRIPAGAAGA